MKTLSKYFLGCIFLLVPGLSLGFCSISFNSAVQTHYQNGSGTFRCDAELKEEPDTIIETMNVINPNNSCIKTCEDDFCSASNTLSSTLNIGGFVYQSGGEDITVANDDDLVLSGSTRDYKNITVKNSGEINFASGSENPVYRIAKLEIQNSAILKLEPGTYWVEEMFVGNDADVAIEGTSGVNLIVEKELKFENSSEVNKGHTADKLFIYAFSDVELDAKSEVVAYIYSKENVVLRDEAFVEGAILAKNVELKTKAVVKYDPSGALNIDLSRVCQSASIDHFRLSTNNTGAYCTPHTVTVYAESSSNQSVSYTGTAVLDTGSGRGDWTKISGSGTLNDAGVDDGVAIYSYVSADNGVASFRLDYIDGSSPINISVSDNINANITDDDSEGLISFAPYALWLTNSVVLDTENVNQYSDTIVAGSTSTMHLTAYGQTVGAGVCGIITSFSGTKKLKILARLL